MKYQILIDNNDVISGNINEAIVVISIIILLAIVFTAYIFKKLKENNRMKYEFITIIAHKFRTPLTYVKWVCDSLIPEENDSFKKKNLSDIKISNQKLIDLTGTLIEIADSENAGGASYVYQKLPICEIVRGLINSTKDSFHEKKYLFLFQMFR